MSELLVPYYRIYIKGKELSEYRYSLITQVVYEDNATGSDLLTIVAEDPDYAFIDDNIFKEDAKVKFIGGYKGDSRTMFEGYISVIDLDFPNTGSPTITLHCMDNSHRLNQKKKTVTWKKKRRSDIAKAIFKKYGLKAVVDPSPKKVDSISQSKKTDMDFLTQLAGEEEDDYLVYIEGNTGYYVKKKIGSKQQATLDYRDGNMKILSFSPRINNEVKQVEV